jgi:GT2 family glycosyltransferase
LTLQLSSVQPFPTISNQLFAFDWLKRRLPSLPLWGMRPLFAKSSTRVHDVEVVSGACMMVHRDVFEEVGCFSSEYFMYAEETDLCSKIIQAGFRIGHVGDASVIHFGGQSTKKREDGFVDTAMRDSIFKLIRKFRGTTYARVYRATMLLSALARLIILAPLFAVPNRLLRRDSVSRAFRKWCRIAKWSMALTPTPGAGNSTCPATEAPLKG